MKQFKIKPRLHTILTLLIVILITPAAYTQFYQNNGDEFGVDIALSNDGSTVIISTYSDSTRVYDWDGNNWLQKGAKLVADSQGDVGGISVGMDSSGNRIVFGASGLSSIFNS